MLAGVERWVELVERVEIVVREERDVPTEDDVGPADDDCIIACVDEAECVDDSRTALDCKGGLLVDERWLLDVD